MSVMLVICLAHLYDEAAFVLTLLKLYKGCNVESRSS